MQFHSVHPRPPLLPRLQAAAETHAADGPPPTPAGLLKVCQPLGSWAGGQGTHTAWSVVKGPRKPADKKDQ